jgi:hypothetical protein
MTRAALSGVALGALLICVVTSATPGRGQNTLTHNDKQERGLQRHCNALDLRKAAPIRR